MNNDNAAQLQEGEHRPPARITRHKPPQMVVMVSDANDPDLFNRRRVEIHGRTVAEVLEKLIAYGTRGVTAHDFARGRRLASDIHKLRSIYGINIATAREAHDQGDHGRYTLCDRVHILEGGDAGQAAA